MIKSMPRPVFQHRNGDQQHVISGRFASGFALGLLAKDVGIANQLAAAMNRTAPVASLVASLLTEASDELGFGVDHTRAYEHWLTRDAV